MAPSERRLSTVLFLDIVGSTRIASDIGDHRWQELLGQFRRIVRAELKKFGGREVNTQGDSFLATFQEPVRAIRAASAIAGAVHEVGTEVRLGIHTGEIEFVEGGNVAGLAVHIGARVMSLAGPAEILVTSTVRELVVGSGVGFEDFSIHELKGVPGTWQLFAVTQVDGSPVPKPLDAADAAARIATVEPPSFLVRRRIGVLVGAGLAVAAVVVALIALFGSGGGGAAGQQSGAGGSGGSGGAGTITLLKVDPHTGQILHELRDQYYSKHLPGTLRSVNGALWQYVPDHLVHRDLATGKVVDTVDVGTEEGISDITIGFGSFWVARANGVLVRLDAISGREQATVDVGRRVVSLGVDGQAVWYLDEHAILGRIDPVTNVISHKYGVGAAQGRVVPLAGSVWICDCDNHRIVQFDPVAQKVARTVEIPEHGFLIGVDSTRGQTMWVLDTEGSTVTPLDAATGQPGQPLGFGGQLHYAQIGFGSIWLASGTHLFKVDLSTHQKQSIAMPPGVSAGGIAIDEQTNSLWVQNCGCPLNE
jgi:class 3 adenylate cyclase/streptogramin lyase